jgi:hypothetical protein
MSDNESEAETCNTSFNNALDASSLIERLQEDSVLTKDEKQSLIGKSLHLTTLIVFRYSQKIQRVES